MNKEKEKFLLLEIESLLNKNLSYMQMRLKLSEYGDGIDLYSLFEIMLNNQKQIQEHIDFLFDFISNK